jgi:hypothetical protein
MAMARENTIWSVERSSAWWEDVLETYNDQQWLDNFRMGRRTFDNCCIELEPHLKPNESFVRAPVEVKKQVAIAIYLFGICCRVQNNWEFLRRKYINSL